MVRVPHGIAGARRHLPRGPLPARLLAVVVLHRRELAPGGRASPRALRRPGAAVSVGGPRQLRADLRRPALLELALADALLRRRLRDRGDAGRSRHGTGPERALCGAPGDAKSPP